MSTVFPGDRGKLVHKLASTIVNPGLLWRLETELGRFRTLWRASFVLFCTALAAVLVAAFTVLILTGSQYWMAGAMVGIAIPFILLEWLLVRRMKRQLGMVGGLLHTIGKDNVDAYSKKLSEKSKSYLPLCLTCVDF